jgi:hypothetical protein
MAEMKEGYWSKHHTEIIQCVIGAYCAVFATWSYFHPRTASTPNQIASPQAETPMTSSFSMPLGLFLGIIALVLSVLIPAILKQIRGRRGKAPALQSSGMIPGIPTLSALLQQDPSVEFDEKKFFALAYYSPVTAETEKNIKLVAQNSSPNDREAFYARFIGVGAVAYMHDWTWFTLYGSQFMALVELNGRGLRPVADLQKHYDKAVTDYPNTYTDYTFKQWLDYMKSRNLIAIYPSQMVEISFGGQDFLRYLAHAGRSLDGRAN